MSMRRSCKSVEKKGLQFVSTWWARSSSQSFFVHLKVLRFPFETLEFGLYCLQNFVARVFGRREGQANLSIPRQSRETGDLFELATRV